MKLRLNASLAGPLLMLALALAAYFAIPYCIAEATATTDVGPQAFPRLICIVAAILSAAQIALVLLGKFRAKYEELSLEKHGKVLLALVLALATAIASNYINVVLAAMICSMLYLVILRVKNWRGYAAVLVTGGFLYALMVFVLHIRF